MHKRILIAIPSLKGKGGVASYYNNIRFYLPEDYFEFLQIGSVKQAGGIIYPLFDQIRFYKAIKKNKPELVHINPSLGPKSFIRDGFFALQAKRKGIPLLIFWRGWDKDFEKKVEMKYLGFFKSTFGRANGFIVLASEFEQKLRAWGVKAPIYRETTCVDDGLLNEFDVQHKWAKLGEGSNIKILFLARLERAKGIFETVQAFKLLYDKKLPVSLTIAGDGGARAELEKFVKSIGLEKLVNFTGYVRGVEKRRILADHHIYCFPTYHGEGLPNSVLEAMAFGMPVVTCPVAGLLDIFQDGITGTFVAPGDYKAIAEEIERFSANPKKIIHIGQYNFQYAKRFMASNVAHRLVDIYKEILKETNP